MQDWNSNGIIVWKLEFFQKRIRLAAELFGRPVQCRVAGGPHFYDFFIMLLETYLTQAAFYANERL
jgi:hypothetical protein